MMPVKWVEGTRAWIREARSVAIEVSHIRAATAVRVYDGLYLKYNMLQQEQRCNLFVGYCTNCKHNHVLLCGIHDGVKASVAFLVGLVSYTVKK